MIDAGIVDHPWHVPQGPTPDLGEHVRAVLMRLVDPLAEALEGFVRSPSATTLLESEEACRRLLVSAIGQFVACVLAWLHEDCEFVARCVGSAREWSSRRLRHQGKRVPTGFGRVPG